MVERVGGMLAARDQLLLDVSHELRSPITRIKVALELLPDGEARAGLATDVRELEAMVTELLELERLRDGRALRPETIDVGRLAREVIAGFGHARPPVALVTGAACLARGDARMLAMTIRNLVDNAVTHALPDSGPVEVSVARDDHGVTVRVADDGPGIPEADLPHVFEPFYRVDRSRSRHTGGYGLGLSICRRTAQAHGGTLTADRKPGRGTVFTLVLPAAPASAPTPQA
jgi:signal transduction histidine kinase